MLRFYSVQTQKGSQKNRKPPAIRFVIVFFTELYEICNLSSRACATKTAVPEMIADKIEKLAD